MSDTLSAWLESFVRAPEFLARYPYYAAVLARLQPVSDPSVETMAVSFAPASGTGEGRFYLHVNVDAFVKEPQFVRGILLHEVHHIVLGHLTHPKFFGAEHPNLMELAEEVSANEHIEEPLPDPITWRTFESIGLRAGQSTTERYEKLVAARVAGKTVGKGDNVDSHPWRPGDKASGPPPGGVEWTRRLIDRAIDEAGEHDPDRPPKLAGRLPGRILEDLVGVTGAPESYVDWKAALQRFVARARAPVHTWARPSRRFPDRIGAVPGRIWRLRPVLRPTILVAIDTSMSMTDRELSEIAKQLVPLSHEARLIIAECDVEITRVHGFEGSLPRVKGRGGTDLRPVFERAFLASHQPDGIVYFTDGQGPFPTHAPERPVLWILTKPAQFDCPWGDRARLDRARR
ncbi:MAG: vWA domain-containing protein [Polyangiales bacterium]